MILRDAPSGWWAGMDCDDGHCPLTIPHVHGRTCGVRCRCMSYDLDLEDGPHTDIELVYDATRHPSYLTQATAPSGWSEAALAWALDGRPARDAVAHVIDTLQGTRSGSAEEAARRATGMELYSLGGYAELLGVIARCDRALAEAGRWVDRLRDGRGVPAEPRHPHPGLAPCTAPMSDAGDGWCRCGRRPHPHGRSPH